MNSMFPGIYTMSPAEYLDDPCDVPSLSCSIAKILLNQTPAHARLAHPRLNPDYEGGEEASRLDIGTACHALLLEGIDSVAVCDFPDWRTKASQEARDVARLEGKIPLLAKQYATVQRMAESASLALADCPDIHEATWSTGKAEQTIIWDEGDTVCRARPDWLANDHGLIIDYKTTELPSPKAWMRAMVGLGYDVQDEFYRRSVKSLTGVEPEFVFMVQSTSAPYLCFFVSLSATRREIARIKVDKALAIWRTCMKADKWPGWPSGIMEAEATAWELADAEEMSAELAIWNKDDAGARAAFLFGSVRDDKKGKSGTLEDFDK